MIRFGQPPPGFSILVIDDDPSLREVLSEYLEEGGFDTRSESSGDGGLLALDRKPCDIVLTDLRMPGMSGLEVVRRVKERWPATEVVVITGYATIEDGVEAMRVGAYDFLLKPIKVDQLSAVLGRCMEWIHHKRSHAELQEVNRRLLELSRMKDKFLAITDHELRTPVTVIEGMLHLVLKRGKDLPQDIKGRLEALAQVSHRLVELVRGIHDLVQSRSNQFPLSPDSAHASEIIQGVLVDFEVARFNRDLLLDLLLEVPESFSMRVDAHRLRQAVTELVQNAVKATPDGGRVTVRIHAADEGRRFCVSVTDTGIGIAPDEQRRIFDLFYEVGDQRHHHTSKFEYLGSGMGIGLSIALEIAKAHGGGIDLQSEPGKGSTFTLWVPTA